ncbi:2-hydroxyacyl-CoA dehydratase family protein [Candidatus Latescibacterota bacterium]
MKRIGITTTVPSEAIWASGAIPVDLNNLFITSERREELIQFAERDGYPRNICEWIKGIYGALNDEPEIETVVAVTQGDCSNTHALMETLQLKGLRTIPFAYPYDRNPKTLAREISYLASELNTTMDAAEDIRERLVPVRALLDRLDEMTWKDNRVSGYENHIHLVSSSDFNGDIDTFSTGLTEFLAMAEKRNPFDEPVRLAYIGVPPVFDDIYQAVELFGARFVLNEVQRQFSLPKRAGGLVEHYLDYTYPYDIFHRLDYIIPELNRRNIHGVVHYVQSFCHRSIEDLIVRKKIPLPILTIEGDSPGQVDERVKIRLQAFIEMLGDSVPI